MRLAWLVCSGLCACSAEPNRAPKTVDVPLLPERAESAPPPARGAPVEASREVDALSYFVGTWDGMVNGSFPTELRVDSSARFFINLKPNPKLQPCHLGGRLQASEGTLSFSVEESTCQAERAGATLVRSIVRKTERELELANEDGSLTIRYSRRVR